MNVWTEILAPGLYRLPDGRNLAITSADVSNAVARGNEMIGSGLRVPGCWEHDLAAFPEYAKNPNWYRAKGYYGDAERFRLNAGKAEVLMSFADEKDFAQFKKVGTTSPRIVYNRIDERGKKWAGLTIAHVASTPTPVQRSQKRLPYDFSATANFAPRTGHYDLSGTDMADELPATDSGTPKTGGGDVMSKVLDMLKGIVAVIEHASGGGGGSSDEMPPDDESPASVDGGADDDDETGAATNATSPMIMSQLPAGAKVVALKTVEKYRRDMIEETKNFVRTGRLNHAEATAHAAKIKTADLSLRNDFELRLTPIVVEHRTYAKMSPRAGWKPPKKGDASADLSGLGEVERPANLIGPLTGDAAKAAENALDYALERAGKK